MNAAADVLTDRQRREREYHRDFAARHAGIIDMPVSDDVVSSPERRPWNAYWSLYDRLLAAGLAGRRVLVPGCGFGADLIRLRRLGAEVSGFDISTEVIDIAARRAERLGVRGIDFRVMTAERLDYPDDSFDAVVFVDVCHHVDIPAAMREVRRVLRPGGQVFGNELYTHSSLQRVRESGLVARSIYPRMKRWIYGTDTPYITEDEHKINEHEFRIVRDSLLHCEADYFGIFVGRLFPDRFFRAARMDRALIRAMGSLGPLLGGRVVFQGEIRKDAVP